MNDADYLFVDDGIREHVRILNDKGYKTIESCESHNKYGSMYIAFAVDCVLDGILELPDGFSLKDIKRDGVKVLSFMYDGKTTDEEFHIKKKEQLDKLLAWCKMLPSVK